MAFHRSLNFAAGCGETDSQVMPVSQFGPFHTDPVSAIRPDDEKAFDDVTNSDPTSETTSGPSSPDIPRQQPPAPVAPVVHESASGDVPQQERREWSQTDAEAAPTPTNKFDFDLHGRLEEAFGAPPRQTAPTSAFDAVVERDLAEEHQAAPELQEAPIMVEPQAPFQDPVVEMPPLSAATKPTSFWNESVREEPQPAAPASAGVTAAAVSAPEIPEHSRVFQPGPSPVPETPAPAQTDADLNLDTEIAAELERAMDDELYLTPENPPVQAGSGPKPIISPQRAAQTIAPLPEPNDPFAKELEKLLASPGGEAGASAPQPPQFRAPSFGEADLYGDMPKGAGWASEETTVHVPFATDNGGKSRSRTVALAIIGVALLGGAAAFALNFFEADPGEIPVITAETDAVKERPTDTGGEEVPNQNQTVYREVEGTSATNVSQETLDGGPEEPIVVSTGPSSNDRETLLQPRTVRTVTVRPDGTIVSRDGQATAPGAPGPVSTTPIGSPTLGITPPLVTPSVTSEPSRVVRTIRVVPPEETAASVPEGQIGETTVQRQSPVAVTAPEPAAEPTQEPVQVAGTRPTPRPVTPLVTITTPDPTPEPTPEPAPPATPEPVVQTAPSVASPYAVQISSQRSEVAAQQTYAKLLQQYPSVLDGRGVDIRRAEIEDRGVFYRVRIPAETRNEAINICESLKASGGSCFVTR